MSTLKHLPRFAARFSAAPASKKSFHTSRILRDGPAVVVPPAPVPVRKPVGAFRGGILGFLAGSSTAGAALYYYVIDEYKVSNQLLTEDIYTLQGAVQRIETYVRSLEERAGVSKK